MITLAADAVLWTVVLIAFVSGAVIGGSLGAIGMAALCATRRKADLG